MHSDQLFPIFGKMKVNFASSTKEPSLRCLNQIMKEVAEEAKQQEEFARRSILEAIEREYALVKKKFGLKK